MFILFSLAVPLWGIVPEKYNLEYEKVSLQDGHWSLKYEKCNKCLAMNKDTTLLSGKHFKWYLWTFLNACNYYKKINK